MTILHLTIAVRTLLRRKLYASISIIGFAFGLACSFLIFLYVGQELLYDRHIAHADRIYRVGTEFMGMGEFSVSQEQLAEYLRTSTGDIEATTRIASEEPLLVRTIKTTKENSAASVETTVKNVYYADSTVFQFFPMEFTEGAADFALNAPNNVVITESLARTYFGSDQALGKTLLIGKQGTAYVVSGVLRESQVKSHLQAMLWLPIYSRLTGDSTWFSASLYTYVRARNGVSNAMMQQNLLDFTKRIVYPTAPFGLSFDKWRLDERSVKFFLTPLTDIHLNSRAKFPISPGGNLNTVYALAGIGFVLLLLVIVNYTNLTTAQSSVRAKEIGIKKTLGAGKSQIALQFWGESLMMTLIAACLAVVFSELLLVLFRYTVEVEFAKSIFIGNGILLVFLFCFALFVGLIAGAYPSLYLARLQPAHIARGNISQNGKPRLRNSLVVVQFVLATVMIICSIVVIQQMNFMQQKDVGLQRENVVILENVQGETPSRIESFKEEITKISGVLNVSSAERVPATTMISRSTYKTLEMPEPMSLNVFGVDANFFSTVGIRLSAGRGFQAQMASDSLTVILNESAVKALALSSPIGAKLYHGAKILTVIGVTRDFHFESLKKSVEPVVIVPSKKPNFIVLRVSPGNHEELLLSLQKLWKNFSPEKTFQYTFMDDAFEKFLRKERVLLNLGMFFTAVSILISCVGLFGLSSFQMNQREKEIGIRKILGASVSKIVAMLSTEFIKLVLFAFCIACPIAWWLMNKWLQDFAYKIEISWMEFALAGVVCVVIALATVSGQSWRAARQNPVNSLRSE